MKAVPSDQLRRMWEASDKTCKLCLAPLELQAASRDHIIPASLGGGRIDNLRLVHRRCNSLWGNDEGRAWTESSEHRRSLMRKHEIETPLELLRFMVARGMIKHLNKGQRGNIVQQAEEVDEEPDSTSLLLPRQPKPKDVLPHQMVKN